MSQRIPLGFGQQDAVGHDLDVGVGAGPVLEADLVAHRLSEILSQFLGDTGGHGGGGDAPGLGAADPAVDAAPGGQAELGDLGGLARSGLPGDDGHRVIADAVDDRRLGCGDRQVIQVCEAGNPFTPTRFADDGTADTNLQIGQACRQVVVGRFVAGAHQPVQFTAQGNAVAVHDRFEQAAALGNLLLAVGHDGSFSLAFTGRMAPFFYHGRKGLQPFLASIGGQSGDPCGS